MSSRVKERISIALLALEALLALPLTFWDAIQGRAQTERVKRLVAHVAVQQKRLLRGARAYVTELAIEALPVRLELGDQGLIVLGCDHLRMLVLTVGDLAAIGRHQLEAVGVKGLAAEGTAQEVSLVAEGTAQVAHLFKAKLGIVEGAFGWIRVVAPVIVHLLVVCHHHLLVLLHVVDRRLGRIVG